MARAKTRKRPKKRAAKSTSRKSRKIVRRSSKRSPVRRSTRKKTVSKKGTVRKRPKKRTKSLTQVRTRSTRRTITRTITRTHVIKRKVKPSPKSNRKQFIRLIPVTPKIETLLKFIIFFCIFGMILAGYLTYNHYSYGSSFCDISETISCQIVNQSTYSEIFGIPVAILGFLAYLTMFILSLLLLTRYDFSRVYRKLHEGHALWFATLLAMGGFGFQTYLAYIEWKVLKTWCPLCITSHLNLFIIMILFFVVLRYYYLRRRGRTVVKGSYQVCEYC